MKTLLRSWWTRRQSRLLLLAFLGAFLIGIALLLVDTHLTKAAPTCTINWTGGGGTTSWFTAANWDQNHLPTTSDNVCIPATNPAITVTYDQNQSTQILNLQSQEALAVSTGELTLTDTTQTSTISNSLTWSGGTLGGGGNLVVAGPMSWSGGTKDGAGTLTANSGITISGTGSKGIGGGTVDNPAGQTTVINGTGEIVMSSGGTFSNEGTVDDQVDLALGPPAGVFFGGQCLNGPGGTVNNTGTFIKSGGTGTTLVCPALAFDNSGTVNVNSGTLSLQGGGKSTGGSFSVPAGSMLDFGGGTYTLDSSSSVTGAGTGRFSGATVTFASGAAYTTGSTTVSGGSVTFNSSAGTGTYTQSGGTLGINLGGSASCTTFGQVNVSGAATLGGTLGVGLTNECSPGSTQSFQIMKYASHSGTFASVNTPTVNGQPMPVSYFPTNVTVGSTPQAKDLTVSTTATSSFTRTYNWNIKKNVDKTLVEQIGGGTATFNYTVNVNETGFTDSVWQVTGKITVTNLNDGEDITANVSDVVDNGGSCTVTGGTNVSVPAGQSVTLSYTCTYSSQPAYNTTATNTATATWDATSFKTSDSSASGSANFTFSTPTTTVNKTVTITDTFNSTTTTLGTLTATDSTPFTSQTFTYPRTVNVPQFNCVKYTNTAVIVETKQSASQTVEVCGPAQTGALSMGFWQNTNGQKIITGGSSTGGVCNSGTWLRQYNPFQDLSSTATCSQVATYVYNIVKAANASGSSMNAMLKAQMLATALDVYFSDPALGGNKIKAPNPIGGVKIDLTMICRMIDGSGGTATCSGTFENVSSAFGGATSLTVSQTLAYAASQSNTGGSTWYGNVKATQVLAKDAFDAINNQVALAP